MAKRLATSRDSRAYPNLVVQDLLRLHTKHVDETQKGGMAMQRGVLEQCVKEDLQCMGPLREQIDAEVIPRIDPPSLALWQRRELLQELWVLGQLRP